MTSDQAIFRRFGTRPYTLKLFKSFNFPQFIYGALEAIGSGSPLCYVFFLRL